MQCPSMANPTVVFDITIPEGECKECSYLELYQDHLTQSNATKKPTDPFAYTDEESERQLSDIAKSFEKKYGTMVTFKKSGTQKRVRIDDYLDPGDGYDTSDSFIDDSEDIDLFVAPNVSTKFGGFFVCDGAVEGMEDQNIKIDSLWGLKTHPNVSTPTHAMKKAKSKALLDRAVKRLSTPGAVKRKSKAAPAPVPSQGQENTVSNSSLNAMANLDDVFDAVLSANAPVNANSMTPLNQLNKGLEVSRSPSVNGLVKPSVETKYLPSQQQTQQQSQQKPTPLPTNLPNEVHILVEKIVTMAQPNIDNQRRVVGKAFDGDLLNLSTTLNTAKVNHTVRAAVFAHTEDRIQWKRKSLTRRLKKLNVASEDGKMNPLLDALGDAILQVMPSILSVYTRDRETHLERMKVWQAESRIESESVEVNGTAGNTTTSGGPDGQAPKRPPKPGPPKKLFRWNEDCRSIFHAIVKRRLESHVALNSKSTREEYLRGLFPTLVQLWPEGWISHAALWRAALPAFHSFNNGTPSSTDGVSIAPPTSTTTTSSSIVRQACSGGNSTVSSSVPSLLQQQVELLLPRRSVPSAAQANPPASTSASISSQFKMNPDLPVSTGAQSLPNLSASPSPARGQSPAVVSTTASRQPPVQGGKAAVVQSTHCPPKTPTVAMRAALNKPTAVATVAPSAVVHHSASLPTTAGYTVGANKNLLYQAVAKAAAMAVTNAAAVTGSVKGVTTPSLARQGGTTLKPVATGTGNCTLSTVHTQDKMSRNSSAATTLSQRISVAQRSADRPSVPLASVLQTRPPQPHMATTVALTTGASQPGNPLTAILSSAQINQLQQRAQALAHLGNITTTNVGRTATPNAVSMTMPLATRAQQPRQIHPPPAHQQHYYQVQSHQQPHGNTSAPATRPAAHQQSLIYQSQHQSQQKRQQLTNQAQQQHQHMVNMVSSSNNNQVNNTNVHLAAANTLLHHIRQINPDQRQHYQ